jgi:hypothetical protein
LLFPTVTILEVYLFRFKIEDLGEVEANFGRVDEQLGEFSWSRGRKNLSCRRHHYSFHGRREVLGFIRLPWRRSGQGREWARATRRL